MRSFYVYVLCDPRQSGEHVYGEIKLPCQPFYVGKGKGRRAWRHHCYIGKHQNPHRDRIIQKLLAFESNPVVVIVQDALSEESAFSLEKETIRLIGRFNLGTGPLANLTEGGDGPSGYTWNEDQRRKILGGIRSGSNNPFFGKKHSIEAKSLMHKAHKDVNGPKNSFYGKHHSEETKALISLRNTGKKLGSFSAEDKARISKALKGKPKQISLKTLAVANQKRMENLRKYGHPSKRVYVVSTPGGESFEIRNLKAWC